MSDTLLDQAQTCVMPDGVAVHYRLSRPAHARGAVMLLHGLASNSTRWSEFVEHTALRNDWDLLRPDLRGHGHSFTRRRLAMEAWSDDLARLLDTERHASAILIGHSLGAHVALHFAARYPERVRGLVLIDPALPQALRGHMRWARVFSPLIRLVVVVLRALNALGVGRRRLPHRDLRALDERVRTELLAHGRAEEFVQRYSSVLADLKYFPVSSYLKDLLEMLRPLPSPRSFTFPTLVLLSRGITYTDTERTRSLLAGSPVVEMIEIDAYHWPLTENPAQVRAAIEGWFSRHYGTPTQADAPH